MGNQRLIQTQTAATDRKQHLDRRTKQPEHPMQEVLGSRAASRYFRTQLQRHQAEGAASPNPLNSILQSISSGNPRVIQAKPMFRGLSHELTSALDSRGMVIQAKMTIGAPGDKYEQEADRVAEQVVQKMHASSSQESILGEPLQHQDRKEDNNALMMKPLAQGQPVGGMAATQYLESSINRAKGDGQPLGDTLRQPLEQAFGTNFGGVRVHVDAQADQLNRSIHARAFTTGRDVFFRQGEYQPGTPGGQELIAHELTHVAQQTGQRTARQQVSEENGKTLRRLSYKDEPMNATEIVTIEKISDKGVWKATSNNNETVVIKIESGIPGLGMLWRTAEGYAGKEAQGTRQKLARHTLTTLFHTRATTAVQPGVRHVPTAEIHEVLEAWFRNNPNLGKNDQGFLDARELFSRVQSGQQECFQMEYIGNLSSLEHDVQPHTAGASYTPGKVDVVRRLLSPRNVMQMGELAYIDSILCNRDRFSIAPEMNLENITFAGDAVIALDNFDPSASKEAFEDYDYGFLDQIKNKQARKETSRKFVQALNDLSGQGGPVQEGDEGWQAFYEGMNSAHKKAKKWVGKKKKMIGETKEEKKEYYKNWLKKRVEQVD